MNFGLLGISWDQTNLLYLPKFNIKVKAKRKSSIHEILYMHSRLVAQEVYRKRDDGGIEIMDVQLDFDQIEKTNHLRVSPNPFRNAINAEIYVEESGWVDWILFDLTGKMINQRRSYLKMGEHQMRFEKSDFPSSGTYLLQVKTMNFTASEKIILIDR